MIVKQLSVFLENRSGSLSVLMKALAAHNINLKALSLAETQDYGILRLIAEDPRKAAALLSEEGYVCNVTEVVAVAMADHAGGAAAVLSVLSDGGIGVEYAYAFASDVPGEANMILRVSDNEAAEKLLAEA